MIPEDLKKICAEMHKTIFDVVEKYGHAHALGIVGYLRYKIQDAFESQVIKESANNIISMKDFKEQKEDEVHMKKVDELTKHLNKIS